MKLFILLISLFSVTSQAAFTGGETGGGGGSGQVSEFRRMAEAAGQAFFEHQVISLKGKDFDFTDFRSVLTSLTVTATHEKLKVNGKEVSAINYPDRNEVILNVDDWLGSTKIRRCSSRFTSYWA